MANEYLYHTVSLPLSFHLFFTSQDEGNPFLEGLHYSHLGVVSNRTYNLQHHIKFADLLSHTCLKPVEAEDGYNSGMFNELCHCRP